MSKREPLYPHVTPTQKIQETYGQMARKIVAPPGSMWNCATCGRSIEPGEEVIRVGSQVYCGTCARIGAPSQRQEYPLTPTKRVNLRRKGISPTRQVRLDIHEVENILKSRGFLTEDEAIIRGWMEPGELIFEVVE